MKTLRIKDICDKGSSNLKQKDVENQNGVYPVFGASGLIGKIDTYHQNKDYIAIVKDGSGIGRVTFMPAFSSVIGTLQYILPKEGFNIKYISYCLQSLDLAHYKQGAAIPHIYFRDYGEYEVNVEENPDDQQRFVTYLDAEFAKIEALKANAEKQLQAAKDLFQAALKELLTPKEGWVEKKLGEVSKSMADGPFGSNLKAQHYTTKKEVRIVQLSNIGEFGWKEENVKYTSFEHLKTISRSEVHCGDIVIAKMMPAGRAIICPNNEAKYVLSSDAVKVELKDGYSPDFIMYSINSNWFNKQVLANVTGSGRIRTSLTKLRDCNLYIPDIETQKEVVEELNMAYMKTKALQTNYAETITLCNDLKQALLKKVFG
jgi:type I restriction enzyme S subunit